MSRPSGWACGASSTLPLASGSHVNFWLKEVVCKEMALTVETFVHAEILMGTRLCPNQCKNPWHFPFRALGILFFMR